MLNCSKRELRENPDIHGKMKQSAGNRIMGVVGERDGIGSELDFPPGMFHNLSGVPDLCQFGGFPYFMIPRGAGVECCRWGQKESFLKN